MNNEQLINLVGNIKLCTAKLENLLTNGESGPSIDSCLSDLVRLLTTYEADEGVVLPKSRYNGTELWRMRILKNRIEAAAFDANNP